MSEPFDLRVVPLAEVIPHEASEPRRVERMVKRLVADDWLGNPPIVLAELGDGFVLIDGANRIAALRELGYRYAIVQVASTSTVRLTTWHHVLLETTPDRLLDALGGVPTVELDPAPSSARDGGAVCTVTLADGRGLGVRPLAGTHPFTALHPVVACYLRQAVVRRATEPDLGAFPDAAALVTFGALTIDEVLGAVRDRVLLPAGITRFVIPGRVLSLNAPLAPLRTEPSAGALNRWLADLVAGRRAEGRVRHYPEPVFVFDD